MSNEIDPNAFLIECQECKKHFNDDAFSIHLRKAHKMQMEYYKNKYPSARVTTMRITPDNKELAKELAQTEKLVDKKKPRDEFAPNEKFDSSQITDPEYVKTVLGMHYPEKLKFFETVKDELVKTGLPDCKALDSFVVIQLYLRDLHLRIMSNPDTSGRFHIQSEDVRALQQMGETTEKLIKMIKDIYEETHEEKRIDEKIEDMLSEAKNYIKSNVGEFSFKCDNCGNMISNAGLPHWAFETSKDNNGKIIYLLWSDIHWKLVTGTALRLKDGTEQLYMIPFWMMAFALETSIEGLLYTARARGMKVEKYGEDKTNRPMAKIDGYVIDILENEEALKLAYDDYKSEYLGDSIRKI